MAEGTKRAAAGERAGEAGVRGRAACGDLRRKPHGQNEAGDFLGTWFVLWNDAKDDVDAILSLL